MKHTIVREKAEFKPVTISITLETQAELDAFGSLCNCNPIEESFVAFGIKLPHYSEMLALGADISNTTKLLNQLFSHPYINHRLKSTYNPTNLTQHD